jgi:hypothetical protein
MARPRSVAVFAGVIVATACLAAVGHATASGRAPRSARPESGARRAAPGTTIWVQSSGVGATNDYARAIAVSPDGARVFVTGVSVHLEVTMFTTVAYDASTGAEQWLRIYHPGFEEGAWALGVSPDGSRVFVTGEVSGFGGTDYATVAYDAATGALLWAKRFDSTAGAGDVATALAVSPDGSEVFVTGQSATARGIDYVTLAYDTSDGARLWARRYQGPAGDDIATAIAADPDGSEVIVTGASAGVTSSLDYATIAYDAATGRTRWIQRYNGRGNGDDIPSAIGVGADGSRVFVTGTSFGLPHGYATLAYDAATGARLWRKRRDAGLAGRATALAVAPDGTAVFVTGEGAGLTGGLDYRTFAYNASTGSILWASRYNGPANGDDLQATIAVRPDGSEVFVTGASAGAEWDYATVAYASATGATLWAQRYDGPLHGTDVAWAVAVRPDGSAVYVTGAGQGLAEPFHYDFTTVAYSTT